MRAFDRAEHAGRTVAAAALSDPFHQTVNRLAPRNVIERLLDVAGYVDNVKDWLKSRVPFLDREPSHIQEAESQTPLT